MGNDHSDFLVDIPQVANTRIHATMYGWVPYLDNRFYWHNMRNTEVVAFLSGGSTCPVLCGRGEPGPSEGFIAGKSQNKQS